MRRAIQWAVLTVLAISPSVMAEERSDFHTHFADVIGSAHGIKTYYTHKALQADLTVTFGGNTIIDGVVTFDTPVGKSRIESANGTVMVFDGKDAWVAPEDAPMPPTRARFSLLTWPYFIAAPFKLADPGTHIEDAGKKPLDAHTILPTGKLTFGENIGDAPDDWYIVYRDNDTGRLAGLAYIVTYSKSVEDAEKAPHVAIYEAFTEVDGVTLPTRMSIYDWDPALGKIGDELGAMEVKNYRFVEPDDNTFTQPEGARIDSLPTPANEG